MLDAVSNPEASIQFLVIKDAKITICYIGEKRISA